MESKDLETEMKLYELAAADSPTNSFQYIMGILNKSIQRDQNNICDNYKADAIDKLVKGQLPGDQVLQSEAKAIKKENGNRKKLAAIVRSD